MARLSAAAGRYGRLVILGLLAAAALLALTLLAVPPAGAQTTPTDYDDDDDGLIDVRTGAQLAAITYDWNADGWVAPSDLANFVLAFPGAGGTGHGPINLGCQTGAATQACRGYELRDDIDLSTYPNWAPLGGYRGALEGNGHKISNLTITGNSGEFVGLFSNLNGGGSISRLAVEGANVTASRNGGSQNIGILAGRNAGVIRMSYVTGSVRSSSSAGSIHRVGGMVGFLTDGGQIIASYSTATVTGPTGGSNIRVGGLTGRNGILGNRGHIYSSYATGAVSSAGGGEVGGMTGKHYIGDFHNSYSTGQGAPLVGRNHFNTYRPRNSYWDRQTSGRGSGSGGSPLSTAQLQRPTEYTGIYAAWDTNVDGVSGNDQPWDFGSRRHYPQLRVDFNNDGVASCHEFGPQRCWTPPPPPGPPPYNPAHDHPEIYENAHYEMGVSCAVQTTWTGDELTTATLTFDLGDYTRPINLVLSLWDGDVFRTLQSQGLAMPELRQNGQTATVDIATDPASTRFRLDSEYGLNLVLGYADCTTDDP